MEITKSTKINLGIALEYVVAIATYSRFRIREKIPSKEKLHPISAEDLHTDVTLCLTSRSNTFHSTAENYGVNKEDFITLNLIYPLGKKQEYVKYIIENRKILEEKALNLVNEVYTKWTEVAWTNRIVNNIDIKLSGAEGKKTDLAIYDSAFTRDMTRLIRGYGKDNIPSMVSIKNDASKINNFGDMKTIATTLQNTLNELGFNITDTTRKASDKEFHLPTESHFNLFKIAKAQQVKTPKFISFIIKYMYGTNDANTYVKFTSTKNFSIGSKANLTKALNKARLEGQFKGLIVSTYKTSGAGEPALKFTFPSTTGGKDPNILTLRYSSKALILEVGKAITDLLNTK